MQFEMLEREIEQFMLAYPAPCPDRKLDGWGATSLNLGEKHRKALSRAIQQCSQYAERLGPFTAFKGYGDLIKALLERKNALLRELERFQLDMLTPSQKLIFCEDATQIQKITRPRSGRKLEEAKGRSQRLPKQKEEEQ